LTGSQEVSGSIPLISTTFVKDSNGKLCFGNKTELSVGVPLPRRKDFSDFPANERGTPFFSKRKIQSVKELAQIKIKINVQLIIATHFHTLDQAADDHLFRFNRGISI